MAKQKTNIKNVLDTQNSLKKEMPIRDNTFEEAIQINESKARLIYREYFICNKNTDSLISIIGFMITCLGAFFGNYENLFNIQYIHVIIRMLLIIGIIVSVVLLVRYCCNRKKAKVKTEDSFINELKGTH